MAEQIMFLRSLTPLDVLQILNRATERAGSVGIEAIRLRIWSSLSTPGEPKVNIALPDPYKMRKRDGSRELYIAIIEEYGQIFPDNLDVRDGMPDNMLPLMVLLPELLRWRVYSDRAAQPLEQEHLLVVPNISVERAAQLMMHLGRFTTSTAVLPAAQRVLVPQTEQPPKLMHVENPLNLFHVLDNRALGSNFSAVLTEIRSPLLAAFRVGEWLIFADPQQPPGQQALEALAALIQRIPGLFGQAATARSHGYTSNGRVLLAALIAWSGATPDEAPVYELLMLRNIAFVDQVQVEPHKQRYSQVIVSNLSVSERAVTQLRQAINNAAADLDYQVGYTLQLRPARQIGAHHLERARIQAQKEDLENRLEYLDSIEPARPILLRFTESQLVALGEYIGSLSIRSLDAGALRYAFQSLHADGTGRHYVLVDPRLAHYERMNRLATWEQADQLPIRFWLDPYWARHYHLRGESLIFVPHQQYLTPTLHPTQAEEIDSYLREIVGQWFHGHHGVPTIPERPIYLFESDPANPSQLSIVVLDLEQFVPLTEKLDWLNANIHVRVARQNGVAIVQQLDATLTDEEILERIAASAAQTQAQLHQALQSSSAHVAAATNALTTMLTNDLRAVLTENGQTRQRIGEALQELRALNVAQAEIANLVGDTQVVINQTNAAIASAATTTDVLHAKIEAELQRAKRAHSQAQQNIDELEQLVSRLRSRLAQI